MYYDRTLSDSFASLIEKDGKLRWLYDFVEGHKELDFLIGKNNSTEWISVYRGLSCILKIEPYKRSESLKFSAATPYEDLDKQSNRKIYGNYKPSRIFEIEFKNIIEQIAADDNFQRYYNNKKEGYFQNILSRRYGIHGEADDEFVILDKEAIVGYDNKAEKEKEFGKYQKRYKILQKLISKDDPIKYGKNLEKKAIGNELDFLALDQTGNILLIEYKHGSNTSGIYLSPLQIGLYYNIFNDFRNINSSGFDSAILSMLTQKQRMGLIHPGWRIPPKLKGIVPVLIISNYNRRSSAKEKFNEIITKVRNILHDKEFLLNLKVYSFSEDEGLKLLSW
jgi:hypothetical protein